MALNGHRGLRHGSVNLRQMLLPLLNIFYPKSQHNPNPIVERNPQNDNLRENPYLGILTHAGASRVGLGVTALAYDLVTANLKGT